MVLLLVLLKYAVTLTQLLNKSCQQLAVSKIVTAFFSLKFSLKLMLTFEHVSTTGRMFAQMLKLSSAKIAIHRSQH